MSQTPMKAIKMSNKDQQQFSALKLSVSPNNNPQRLKDFLANKQKQVNSINNNIHS